MDAGYWVLDALDTGLVTTLDGGSQTGYYTLYGATLKPVVTF